MPPKRSNPRAKSPSQKPHAVRRDRDAYLTPLEHALAIVYRLSHLIPAPNRIVEPSAGTGNFVRAAKTVWGDVSAPLVMAVDLYPSHHRDLLAAGAASYVTGDWLAQDVRGFKPDLILGNPPFSAAEKHLMHALAMLETGKHLAFLLPITYQTTQGRAERVWKVPEPKLDDRSTWPGLRVGAYNGLRYVVPLAERPSFTNNGHTDMAEYALYVWEKDWVGFPTFIPHIWRADALVCAEERKGLAAAMAPATHDDT